MTFSTGEDVNLVTKNLFWLVDGIISLPITRGSSKSSGEGFDSQDMEEKAALQARYIFRKRVNTEGLNPGR